MPEGPQLPSCLSLPSPDVRHVCEDALEMNPAPATKCLQCMTAQSENWWSPGNLQIHEQNK